MTKKDLQLGDICKLGNNKLYIYVKYREMEILFDPKYGIYRYIWWYSFSLSYLGVTPLGKNYDVNKIYRVMLKYRLTEINNLHPKLWLNLKFLLRYSYPISSEFIDLNYLTCIQYD